jgi:hypothetical protein
MDLLKMLMCGLSRLWPAAAYGPEEQRPAVADEAPTSLGTVNYLIVRFLGMLGCIPGVIVALMVLCWHTPSKRPIKASVLSNPVTEESDDDDDQLGEYGLCDVELSDDGEGPYDLPLDKYWEGEGEEDYDESSADDSEHINTWTYRSPILYNGYQ